MRLARDQPVAVELELEQPAVARERLVRALAVHRLHRCRIDVRARRTGLLDRPSQLSAGTLARHDFLDGQAREYGRFRKPIARLARLRRPGVALLDEQPVLVALLELHERPPAVQLVALELEQQFSLLESCPPILERHPFAAVPDDDAAGAVVSLRNISLEVAVLERMVLDLHGQPLVAGVVRGSLGNRPRAQDAVHLQPQVEMEVAGRVLVHDEQVAGDRRHGSHRLGRPVRRPLGAVRTEVVGRVARVATCGHANFAQV